MAFGNPGARGKYLSWPGLIPSMGSFGALSNLVQIQRGSGQWIGGGDLGPRARPWWGTLNPLAPRDFGPRIQARPGRKRCGSSRPTISPPGKRPGIYLNKRGGGHPVLITLSQTLCPPAFTLMGVIHGRAPVGFWGGTCAGPGDPLGRGNTLVGALRRTWGPPPRGGTAPGGFSERGPPG